MDNTHDNTQPLRITTLTQYHHVRQEAERAKAASDEWGESNDPHGENWAEGSALYAKYSRLNTAADFYAWNYRTEDGAGVNRAEIDALAQAATEAQNRGS